MPLENAQQYNDPAGGAQSSIGSQIRTDYYEKRALSEVRKEQYFSQLSGVKNMPTNMGKKIKMYQVIPLLDDANINDQGIDAAGATTTQKKTIIIQAPNQGLGIYQNIYAVGDGATAAAALAAAKLAAVEIFRARGVLAGTYAATKTAVTALTPAWIVDESTPAVPATGNLYGSSKDVGTIQGKLPSLTETGGRVNRVGFHRRELSADLQKFGFFTEWTKDSVQFDSQKDKQMYIHREMLNGANELNEDAIQIDLLNGAGIVRFAGAATTTTEISGETGAVTKVTYKDLMQLAISLDNTRTPKKTTMITGTRLIDTKVIDGARVLFVGSEIVPQLKEMATSFGKQAFISLQHYAAGGTAINGEIGSIDQFRIVVVPEMMHWAGAGADATVANEGYRETGGKYDVFPLLSVGTGAFTTVGFQTDGKSVKFQIISKDPGKETADRNDPYGEVGFMSIKWFYTTLIERPERIALLKTVAEF